MNNFTYDKPDKYEEYCGIEEVKREWVYGRLGLWFQRRNYSLDLLDSVYTDGYRDKAFRDESISEIFDRIACLPPKKSENKQRLKWFLSYIKKGSVLDIGSGFGIWPYSLRGKGFDVVCVEPNKESADFIQYKLGIDCIEAFFEGGLVEKFDIVSMVHVLEHIENTAEFLSRAVNCLKPNGKLFVEVPDAIEFEYLPDDHDEFNSCHIWFFSTISLIDEIESFTGMKVIHVNRPYYKDRKLSRIQVICEPRSASR